MKSTLPSASAMRPSLQKGFGCIDIMGRVDVEEGVYRIASPRDACESMVIGPVADAAELFMHECLTKVVFQCDRPERDSRMQTSIGRGTDGRGPFALELFAKALEEIRR